MDIPLSRRGALRFAAKAAALVTTKGFDTPIETAAPVIAQAAPVAAEALPAVSAKTVATLNAAVNSETFESLFCLVEDIQAETRPYERVLGYAQGHFENGFDLDAYVVLENMSATLEAIQKEKLSLGVLRQDPALIAAVYDDNGWISAPDKAKFIAGVPDFLEELFGKDLSTSAMLEKIEQLRESVLLAAVDYAETVSDLGERRDIFFQAVRDLRADHPCYEQIDKNFEAVDRRLRGRAKRQKTKRDAQQTLKEQKLQRKLYRDGVRRSISCRVIKTGHENKCTVYIVTWDNSQHQNQTVTIAAVHAHIQKYRYSAGYPQGKFSDLRIGKEYVLRQDGDDVVKIVTAHEVLKDYLGGSSGSIYLSVRIPPIQINPSKPLHKKKSVCPREKAL